MPPCCCRCNGSGRCINCVCAKAGRTCSNCLPSRGGRCQNVASSISASSVGSRDLSSSQSSTNATTTLHAQLSTAPSCNIQHSISTPQPSTSSSCVQQSTSTPRPSSSSSCVQQSTSTLQPSTSSARVQTVPDTLTQLQELPRPVAMAEAHFTWGPNEVSSDEFIQSIKSSYAEVVHWKRNIFSVPSGKAGKSL